jgi:hypothetical protein
MAGVHRGREVNSAKDTGRTIFARCLREAPEFAGEARIGAPLVIEKLMKSVLKNGAVTVAAAAPSAVSVEG